MKDPIDVGLSGPLQTGFYFFDHLHAASPGPALRLACLATGQAGYPRLFHVPHSPRDGLGPLCTPAVRHSRRATLDGPTLTAGHILA